MIEKIKNWKILYRDKDIIKKTLLPKVLILGTDVGLVVNVSCIGKLTAVTDEQLLGWNIYSVVRMMFDEYELIDLYRMKKGKYCML